MKLKELDLPNGWMENEHFAESMVGTAAAYKTEDNRYWIEVAERGTDEAYPLKVELRKTVAGKPETAPVKTKDAKGYDDAADKVVELAEYATH